MHGHGVSTTAPACHGHSAVAHGDCIYVYGGDAKDNRRISDLYKFSISTATTPMLSSLERMHKRERERERERDCKRGLDALDVSLVPAI